MIAQLKVEDILIEINHTEKESDCLITTHMWNLKYFYSFRLRTEWCLQGVVEVRDKEELVKDNSSFAK